MVSHGEYADRTDRQTDGRTGVRPLHCAFRYGRIGRCNNERVHGCTKLINFRFDRFSIIVSVIGAVHIKNVQIKTFYSLYEDCLSLFAFRWLVVQLIMRYKLQLLSSWLTCFFAFLVGNFLHFLMLILYYWLQSCLEVRFTQSENFCSNINVSNSLSLQKQTKLTIWNKAN